MFGGLFSAAPSARAAPCGCSPLVELGIGALRRAQLLALLRPPLVCGALAVLAVVAGGAPAFPGPAPPDRSSWACRSRSWRGHGARRAHGGPRRSACCTGSTSSARRWARARPVGADPARRHPRRGPVRGRGERARRRCSASLAGAFRCGPRRPTPAPWTTRRAPPARHRLPLWRGPAVRASAASARSPSRSSGSASLDMAVKSTAFTFGTVLPSICSDRRSGCLTGAPAGARLRDPLRVVPALQCVLLAYAAAAVAAPGRAARRRRRVRAGTSGTGGKRPVRPRRATGPVQFRASTSCCRWPSSACPRAHGPVLPDPAARRARRPRERAAARSACCRPPTSPAASPAACSSARRPDLVGTTGTFRALMVFGLVFAAVGARRLRWRVGVRAPGRRARRCWPSCFPARRALWLRLHGRRGARPAWSREDATGVGAIVPRARAPGGCYVNGKRHSWIPFGGIHTPAGRRARHDSSRAAWTWPSSASGRATRRGPPRLPTRDAVADRVRDLGRRSRALLRRLAARCSRLRAAAVTPRRSAAAHRHRRRPQRPRAGGPRATTSSRPTRSGRTWPTAATSTPSSSSSSARAA